MYCKEANEWAQIDLFTHKKKMKCYFGFLREALAAEYVLRMAKVGGFFEWRVGGGGFCDGGGVGGVAEERRRSGDENNSGFAGRAAGAVMITRRCISRDAKGLFSG